MDAGGDELIAGHSTEDALRILHDELFDIVQQYEARLRFTTLSEKWQRCFLRHDNRHSPFHWTSCLLLILLSFGLLLAFALQEYRDYWLLVEAMVLLVMLVLNCYYLGWDDQLRHVEVVNRAKYVLSHIDRCTRDSGWISNNYINPHAPLSPCVSLQWTCRDAEIVNLPQTFLVEGDIILLRPGQTVPAKCKLFQVNGGIAELTGPSAEEYKEGDFYNPDQEHSADMLYRPEARDPLKPKPFMVLETPFVNRLRDILIRGNARPVSPLNNERYGVYSFVLERIAIPFVFLVLFLTNLLRFLLLQDTVGHWTDMLIVRQIHGVLPLAPVTFPIMWKLLDMYGVSKMLVTFKKLRREQGQLKNSIEEFGSTESLEMSDEDTTWTWSEVWDQFKIVFTGKVSDTLPRTCNIVHALGSVTSLCCVDKKGVLSWPNPTPEKVFFLRNDIEPFDASKPGSSYVSAESIENFEGSDDTFDKQSNISLKNFRLDSDYFSETRFEVLDLTPDSKTGYGLQFDDPRWKKYLPSLKPLGLNILLNTCNLATVERYTQFADHVTCASLKREIVVPVVNRRCFCELALHMGFTEKAMQIFETLQTLGIYRHVPQQTSNKERYFRPKSAMKFKMPMPNVFSVVAKEENSGMLQLMSQGTADLILDVCSDYWNGTDLRPLTEADRKKILDFYHRNSMASYCTAFSYCPLTQPIGDEFNNVYVEVPEYCDEYHSHIKSPGPDRTWELEGKLKSFYHGSVDSLMYNAQRGSIHDVDDCFKSQCNQIFIGLITMQYQAKPDVVQMIEDLDSACIRFVHFSKENELRSRVFSEKMGLEAGWNCHISLLGDKDSGSSPTSVPDLLHVPEGVSSHHARHSTDSLMPENANAPPKGHMRRLSAPGAISLDTVMVKFEQDKLPEDECYGESLSKFSGTPEQMIGSKRNYLDVEITEGESMPEVSNTMPLLQLEKGKTGARTVRCQNSQEEGENVSEPLLEHDTTCESHGTEEITRTGETERRTSSESYHASSHITENTDSVTGGFGLANRAKLPKGIENIRPHIDNVDNVPLLVSLFTDCNSDTTEEMIKILQEYGEVAVVLGSSVNIYNTNLFVQADCSLAVEPMFTQVCSRKSALHRPYQEDALAPMELCSLMHSIPCGLSFQRHDHIKITKLVALARDHCQSVRALFMLMLMLQLFVLLLHVLNNFLLMPPILATHHVLWLVAVALPLLSITPMGAPLHHHILKVAMGKNMNHLKRKVLLEFILYFTVIFGSTSLVCICCFSLNLHNFCQVAFEHHNNTCHIFYGQLDDVADSSWNGWVTHYSLGLTIAQNFTACQVLVYSVCLSLSLVHRLHHLWQRSPLVNKLWCAMVPCLLGLQILYFAVDVVAHIRRGAAVSLSVHDIPIPSWVLALTWPFLLIAILELIKRREIKLNERRQKRARLDFGTKLGMNSPF